MNKGNLNKLVTNYPVELTEEEIANLSGTLAPVIAACGGGGGGAGGKIYTGIGFVTVNNSTNQIGLTEAANTKLNQDIPTKVSDLTDSANYQTVAGMDQYETTQHASQTYLTKSSASQNLAPISVIYDIEDLKSVSGDFNNYYTKEETDVIAEAAKSNAKSYAYNLSQLKQDKLTFEYDSNDAISSINHSALAGQGGTTYSAGAGIAIVDEYISLSADYIQAITQVSGKQNTISFTYTTAEEHPNVKYLATMTTDNEVYTIGDAAGGGGVVPYEGKDGVYVLNTDIGLSADYKTQIEAVSSKLTKASADTLYAPISVTGDVNTLKSSSGNWDKVSDKLDTTAFSTVSGTFLTKSSADNDYAPKTYTATVNALTGASGNWQESYEVLTSYSAAGTWLTAHQSLTNYYTKSETSGATELSTEFGKYALKSEIPTVPTKVSDLTDSANYYKTTETSSKNELSTEFAKYQPTGDYVTSAGLTAGKQYAMTTTGWAEVQAGTSFTGVTTASPITGDGLNNSLGLDSNYKTAIEQVSGKVDKPADMTSNKPYCFSGGQWADITQTYYSKTEATGTFLQKNLTNTLSGDGTSSNTLGVNWSNLSSNLINSANTASNAWISGTEFSSFAQIKTAIDSKQAAGDYLYTSGGTLSGELIVSAATGTFDNSYIKCVNDGNGGYSRFGVGSYGGAVIKAVNGNNNVQVNVKYNENNNELIQVQKSNNTVGYLIPAVTSTTTAGLTNDGILHIILES